MASSSSPVRLKVDAVWYRATTAASAAPSGYERSRPARWLIEASRAALSRPTRLRWLAGRGVRIARRGTWYEAVEGLPLSRALEGTVDWSTARHWLTDLAHELTAQGPEVPPLDADRVWILDTGRAKLLDDPTEDVSRTAEPDARLFLSDILRSVRSRVSGPWPGSAERMLRDAPTAPLSETSAQLEAHLKSRATVARPWRLAALVTLVLPALLFGGLGGSTAALLEATRRDTPPELRFPISAIQKLKYDGHWTRAGRPGS